MSKIVIHSKLKKVINNLPEKKRIVLTGGCFDILHLGHVEYLEKARAKGDYLVVLLESDQKIRQLKGKGRPIHNVQARAKILSALETVDLVVILPDITRNEMYDNISKVINPYIIATSENDQNLHHKQRIARMVGAKLKVVNKEIKGLSSTKLIKQLLGKV